MTVSELIDKLVHFSNRKPGNDTLEFKVWLPGSRISLTGMAFEHEGHALLEGNIDKGSALDTEAAQ